MSPDDKPLVWLGDAIRTPPFSRSARLEGGFLLRRLQQGESLAMPHSRPMPMIGRRCHELRIVYRIDPDALILLDVFSKKTRATPKSVIDACRRRLRAFDAGKER